VAARLQAKGNGHVGRQIAQLPEGRDDNLSCGMGCSRLTFQSGCSFPDPSETGRTTSAAAAGAAETRSLGKPSCPRRLLQP
jgi:hypothetical protein